MHDWGREEVWGTWLKVSSHCFPWTTAKSVSDWFIHVHARTYAPYVRTRGMISSGWKGYRSQLFSIKDLLGLCMYPQEFFKRQFGFGEQNILCMAIIAKIWHGTLRRMFLPDSFPEPLLIRRHMTRGSRDKNIFEGELQSRPQSPSSCWLAPRTQTLANSKAGNGKSPSSCRWPKEKRTLGTRLRLYETFSLFIMLVFG